MNNNKILVLGANGMLGKMISLYLDSNNELDVSVTSRKKSKFIMENFEQKHFNFEAIHDNIGDLINKKNSFSYIINCIGAIKPKIDEQDNSSISNTVFLNAYFPFKLQRFVIEENIQYIQIGTDCVFSGNDGNYNENCFMDANDLYGKSKIVGEIEGNNKHILRSSIIGPEAGEGFSLMNWFLKNKQDEVSGFQNHQWNGVTTLNFSRIVEGMIKYNKFDFKTQHLIPKNTISKAQLLEEIKIHFNKNINVKHTNAETLIDRTLKTENQELNEELWKFGGYNKIPSIEENIEELANSEIVHRIIN